MFCMPQRTSSSTDLMQSPDTPLENPLAFLEESLNGLRRYQAVMAAYELGLFTLMEEPKTVAEIAGAVCTRPDLTGLLCEGLAAFGLLKKEGDRYGLMPFTREYLLPDAQFSQQPAIVFQNHLAGLWLQLPGILREGPVVFPREQTFRDLIIPSMASQARCGLLQRVCGIVGSLREFPLARNLLDLGGGHGLYAIAFCQKNPRLKATVFDLPQVTAATRDFISTYSADRVTVQPGDFFTDSIGSGYDIIFSSSNPGGKVPALIPKIASALNDGGLYINKQGIDDLREDPFLSLEWNLWTFEGIQKQGRRYVFSNSISLADYNRQMPEHGLEVQRVIPIDEQSALTIARKKG
jgi:hypothetical protein